MALICPYMSKVQTFTATNTGLGETGLIDFVSNTDENVHIYKLTNTGTPQDEVFKSNVECIGVKCQCWDNTNSRCGMMVTDTIMTPTNETPNLIGMLEDVVGKNSELLGDDQSILALVKHYHDTHVHNPIKFELHEVTDVPATKGGGTAGGMPPANILMQEVMAFEDIDSNGLIYLKDFIFDLNDPNVPPLIVQYTQTFISSNDVSSLQVYTWEQYEETI